MGGSSALNIAIGIVRTKVVAILLGPTGVGLLGIYGSIVDLMTSISGVGINSSGVRQIAEAVSSDDQTHINTTVTVLRRISLILAIIGAISLVLLANKISLLTFGDSTHAYAIALLSLAVFFRLIADSRSAIIQGKRRLVDLAKMSVLNALVSTIVSILLIYFFRQEGVALSLVGISMVMLIFSWFYSKKLVVCSTIITNSQFKKEVFVLLKFGFAFMASGILMIGTSYIIRTLILRTSGYDAAGFYQAAWTLGGLYVGFILQAMGTDFYPRLTGVIRNNNQCNRMVNEQAQISLLLAAPGVLATLTFAPIIVSLFYSSEFRASVDILRWICLGIALRVISWPMGYIILAKGNSKLFFLTELAWAIVNISFSWIFMKYFGLNGAGMAFFSSYIFHGFFVYLLVNKITGFFWSSENLKTGIIFVLSIGMAFYSHYLFSPLISLVIGTLIFFLSAIYSLWILQSLVSLKSLPLSMKKFFSWIKFRYA